MDVDFKSVFNNLPGVYLLLNPDMTIAAASNDRLIATNTTRENILGKNLFEVFPDNPNDPQANGVSNLKYSIERVLHTKRPHRMAIQRYDIPKSDNSKEFEERYWSPLNSPVFNDQGDLIFIIHVVEDVTAKIKAENETKRLEESEYRFRQIANTLPQSVWTARPNGIIDWHSDKYKEFDDGPEGPIHPEDFDFTIKQWKQSISSGDPLNVEQRMRLKDAQYRWHLSKAEPVRDAAGRILKWVGSTTDIHNQKIYSEKLKLERDLRARFVSTLSHDLRTPLTAAKMAAQLLSKKVDDPEFVRLFASKIVANIDRCDEMILDLLDANRIQAGEKLPLEISECNISKIVLETIENLRTVHGDRFVLTMSLKEILGFWSSNSLKRIIENLCNNAVKYGAKDKKISIKIVQSVDQVLLSVHNWGNPISLEDQKTLFEQFRRTVSAIEGDEKGWGLGLTLVKGITEAHKGKVSVESSEDNGTTFKVCLPLDARS